MPVALGSRVLIERAHLDALIAALAADDRAVIGPTFSDGAIVYAPVAAADDLPRGVTDEQEGGRYRAVQGDGPALFGYTAALQSWKRHLYPPRRRLFAAVRGGDGFRLLPEDEPAPRLAFLGVRACELAAMRVQDAVLAAGIQVDPDYAARRADTPIVAVQCGHSAATCFCASMGSGPRPQSGFDLLLSELAEDGHHAFVAEVGSARGAALLEAVPYARPSAADLAAAEALAPRAAAMQTRRMAPDAERLLKAGLESSHWEAVAERCLTCGNCTMVCPTCFCVTVEDTTDLGGERAERWRRWDSCFTLDFAYIHGGTVRREASARYRQWITHKLAHWHDQFGMSGCVGCGRCITWCPVGIDITAEVAALAKGD